MKITHFCLSMASSEPCLIPGGYPFAIFHDNGESLVDFHSSATKKSDRIGPFAAMVEADCGAFCAWHRLILDFGRSTSTKVALSRPKAFV